MSNALSPRSLDRVNRANRVVGHVISGFDFDEIAAIEGYVSPSDAKKDFDWANRNALTPNVEQWRNLQSMRYTAIIRVLWPLVMEGHLTTIDRVLKIIKQQSELHGLIQPAQVVNVDQRRQSISMHMPKEMDPNVARQLLDALVARDIENDKADEEEEPEQELIG